MLRTSSRGVYELASKIPGLSGETPHANPEACIEETGKNIAWVISHSR